MAVELDRHTIKEIQRLQPIAEADQREAFIQEITEKITFPLLRAIQAVINENPDAATEGMRVLVELKAHRSVPQDYATTSEIAERFRVSQQQVRRWCESGKIVAERTPGGTWRIPTAQFKGVGAMLPLPSKKKQRPIDEVAGAWEGRHDLAESFRSVRDD